MAGPGSTRCAAFPGACFTHWLAGKQYAVFPAHTPMSNLQNLLCGQENGSILLGIGESEECQLAAQNVMLGNVGICSYMLDERELREAEPALDGSKPMAGLLVSNDAQLVTLSTIHAGTMS